MISGGSAFLWGAVTSTTGAVIGAFVGLGVSHGKGSKEEIAAMSLGAVGGAIFGGAVYAGFLGGSLSRAAQKAQIGTSQPPHLGSVGGFP